MKKLFRLAAGCALLPIGLLAQPAPAKPSAAASLEQRVRAIEDREGILKTMYQYAYLVDFGQDIHEYTDLYTEDAVFQSIPPAGLADIAHTTPRPGNGAVIGHQGLEKWITNEWQARDRLLAAGHYRIHTMIEPDIALDGDRASARSYFQTTDNDNGRIYIVSIGVYKDLFVRSADGRWRMKERLLIRQGAANPGGAVAATATKDSAASQR